MWIILSILQPFQSFKHDVHHERVQRLLLSNVGYRHIDCARAYRNEKEIGDALKEMFQKNVVKREDLFITSKLWSADHAPEDVPLAFDKTLKDLQLDYIDLYLIHWPMRFKRETTGYGPEVFAPLDIPSTWRAMEKLLSNGKVRAIGVSNFSTKKLQDLISYAKVVPAVNQVECHPMWQQHKLHEFCKSQGIHLSAYSPLGSAGSGWTAVRLLEHPLLKQIAEQLGKTPAHAAIRWGLQSGHSVLPKTINKDRVKSNFEVFDWSIPKEIFDQFSQIKQEKLITGEFFVHETLSPYKSVEELWDGEI